MKNTMKHLPENIREELMEIGKICDSKYKLNCSVEKSDLEYLEERVKVLQKMTDKVCQEKLDEFKIEREKEIEISKANN